MLRFVILAHDWPTPHFDLLMEAGEVLRAWRLHADPTTGDAVPATPNVHHRSHYLDYEGEVSGGRGTVRRIDAGTFEGELGETFRVAWRGATAGVAELRRDGDRLLFARPHGPAS